LDNTSQERLQVEHFQLGSKCRLAKMLKEKTGNDYSRNVKKMPKNAKNAEQMPKKRRRQKCCRFNLKMVYAATAVYFSSVLRTLFRIWH
jgi:hypothetical protein